MKKHLSNLLIPLIFLLGLALLAYPSFSNWWNERHQSRAIASYDETVAATDNSELESMLAAAEEYNTHLLEQRLDGELEFGMLTDEQLAEYNALLDVTGTEIMGVVRIPKIDVNLPIYHGTDEAVLQIAVGHIEGSSLPIGGKGTHAVLSGHRGLPSALLFTNIDRLGVGDVFMITCLGRKVTYEVDQIKTVLPSEVDDLVIDPDQDYCTLVTCTPYGINSHRLLVRGHRIENLLDDEIETIEIDVPVHELSPQERIQQFLPYVLILAAGFFGLALILPGRKRKDDDADEWARRRAARDARRERRDRDDHADQDDRREHDDHAEDADEPEFYDDDDDFYDDDSYGDDEYDDE